MAIINESNVAGSVVCHNIPETAGIYLNNYQKKQQALEEAISLYSLLLKMGRKK